MPHRSHARLLAGSVHRWGAALAGAAVCLAAALPAVAHTELIGSSPADGATLTTPPAEVLLEFSEPVQTEFGQVAVLDDADVHHEQGNAQIVGATGDAGSRRTLGRHLPDLVPRRSQRTDIRSREH